MRARRRHLFLLGHMRSYSSVLSHILGSHAQIDGYCETHIKYRTGFDLWRLQRRVPKLTGEPLRGDYVLDKVLHDYPIAPSILNSSRTRGIVLVRRPGASVRSIIEMGLTHSPVPWHRDFEQVARYYETRLAGLLRLTGVILKPRRPRAASKVEPSPLMAKLQDPPAVQCRSTHSSGARPVARVLPAARRVVARRSS